MTARLIIAMAFLVGCHGHKDDEDHEVAEPTERSTRNGAGSSNGGISVVKIEPEMLRDLRVTIGKATLHAAGERVSAISEVHVNEDAYAEIAAPVSARVARVLAKPGDPVKVGQVLAELRSPDLAQARATAEAARAHLDVAKANADRKRGLAADRLIPERERIEADAALTEADAAYKVAVSGLRKYGGTEGETGISLKSPVAGTVIDRDVVVGQLADPSKTLFKVGDLSTLWLVAHVFERDAVRVQSDGKGTASFAALPGKTRDVMIKWIGREVDPASRTIAIRFDVANADGVLRPGMTATVSIPLGDVNDQAICVPAAAVQRIGESWVVFVPQGPGQFAVRPIGRGRDLGGEVEVMTGLTAGEEIVVGGAFLLKAEADKARGGGDRED
ncbi:MAG: Cobalt/zinc/cadmium efflux transporter, rane fusion protein CzcB family [Myxococcales bacterium]|nr:Cobalt/zinc/cadmium efflux transporter, rane fusion protein CzcB family [Myxococcales bacterium]